MIKGALLAAGILVVCTLENIGHYFGICFHGYLANIVGWIAVGGFAIAAYIKDFEGWLITMGNWHHKHKHKCNHHKHHKEEI